MDIGLTLAMEKLSQSLLSEDIIRLRKKEMRFFMLNTIMSIQRESGTAYAAYLNMCILVSCGSKNPPFI
jgi:hypothetical protein